MGGALEVRAGGGRAWDAVGAAQINLIKFINNIITKSAVAKKRKK